MNKTAIPNILTNFRVLVIPFFIASFFVNFGWYYLPFTLFALASLSDFFDGYLARKWNVESNYGRFLDPLADKLLVNAALAVLLAANSVNAIAAIAIILRETFVGGIREYLGGKAVVKVSMLAKIKTASQMLGIALILCKSPLYGNYVVCFAAVIGLITAYQYYRDNHTLIKQC
jgi:CDP-diacylglycerol--glycerol-3-phosphate 3-phosphatidyltransferase